MKLKITELMAVLAIQLILTLPFYTADAYGLSISGVAVTKVTPNSATIQWQTDNLSNGKVRYGATTSLGFIQRHDDFVSNHSVTVFNGISSGTTYFFSVESADLAGSTAVDNNSNNFYTFTTTDITPPPQVTGLMEVSATSSSIFLSWDNANATDFSHYAIYRNRIPVANSTTNSFNDTGLSQNTGFSYKVSAVDTSGNEGALSDTLLASTPAIDITPPAISNIDVLPITDAAARVSWATNENATTIVFYGMNATSKLKSSSELVLNHSIVIDGLVKNANFAFIVQSCDASGNCANSTMQSFVAGRDNSMPFINLSIPRFVNRRFIDIIGSTKPFTSVTLFVNDMGIPKRSLSSNEVNSGKFAFSQVQLQQDNTIKIVVADRFGNRNQKIFQVSVDTQVPAVQLNDIPGLTSKVNQTISGFVSKPVTIEVYVDAYINESTMPSQITGLNATRIGQNFVELHWDESKDKYFSHYVVYRADASPIAVTKPANFNFFIDALVDSGKSYTYEVSEIDIFANEGLKSEPVTVTTPSGGAILNLKPPEVDIFEDFRKPVMRLNSSGSFDFGVRLNKGDGLYNLKIVFTDLAGNSVIIEKSITLDTTKPLVKITSPPPGAFIFENVANEIDVVGTTKPNSRVHLFVGRTPFTLFNESFEATSIPPFIGNEIQNIPEAQLDAKCRFNVGAKSACRTGADFSATADSNGNFKFEKVDLTAAFGGAARLREVPATELREIRLNPESSEAKTTGLFVVATDATGQRGFATSSIRIGTCWSGNQSWDVVPLTEHQSPTLLSTERLTEGTETIYFYLKYNYIGRGQNAKITDISLLKACSSREVTDPRFNISCQILPSGGSAKLNKPDNTLSYSAIQLARFPGMDTFLESDWKSFLRAINKEMTFPFKVRITYEHDVVDSDGATKRVSETQTTCEQISYVVDNTLINPKKVLPDWLLFNFVDFLQNSIKTLTNVQSQIDKLINFVAVGCLVSFGAHLATRIYRIWVEFSDETLFRIKDIANIKFNLGSDTDNNDCREIANAVKAGYGLSIISGLKLKYFSDSDLKKCFPASASAWKIEAQMYQLQRWSCDRIFGHAAPSRWTESAKDEELRRAVTTEKTCASDLDTKGQRIWVENCRDVPKRYLDVPKNPSDIPPNQKCFRVNVDSSNPQKQGIYTFADSQEPALNSNRVYTLTSYERNFPPGKRDIYAIKMTDTIYMTYQSQICRQICGIQDNEQTSDIFVGGGQYVFAEGKPPNVPQKASQPAPQQQPKTARIAGCVTVNQCRAWNAKSESSSDGIRIPGVGLPDELLKGYTVHREGYTSDCFFNGNPGSLDSISDTDANLRKECCCVNGKISTSKDIYYQPDETDPKLKNTILGEEKVHQSKSNLAQPPKTGDYADMEWSYRYANIGYLSEKYNPNRYIEGRDLPACLGQNNLFYQALGKEREVLFVDPFKQDIITTVVPCVYLTGLNQRLQMIKNIMTAMSTCLIQVRTTGRADSGACKELFTQHLCGLIWQGIRWFIDGCTPENLVSPPDEREAGFTDYLKAGFRGISQGISEAQQEVSKEYGNAKLNDLFGTGEEGIARKVCLAAFGYDWQFSAQNLVDAAYSAPFATLVQPITRSREFLTIEPVSLKPRYEYRASWVINPGCDLDRYDVQLACVSRKEEDQYPNQINCGAIGAPSVLNTGAIGTSTGFNQCDCLELPQEQTLSVFSENRLKQNSLVNRDWNKVIESDRRYDHLKFILRTDRRIPANTKSSCFPSGYDNGVFYFPLIDKTARDIADCSLDIKSGTFSCGGGVEFFSRKGIAELLEVNIYVNGNVNGKRAEDFKEASIGDSLSVGARVRKTGTPKCIRVSLNNPVASKVYFITENGTFDVPPIQLADRLMITGGNRDVSTPENRISVQLLGQDNSDGVDIAVEFTSPDSTFNLNDPNDKASIETLTNGFTNGFATTDELRTLLADTNGQIIVEKNRAKIKINTPISLKEPLNKGEPYRLGGVIHINAPQQSQQQGSQQKTVAVELFHTKDDNPNECSLSDLIVKREYRFIASSKPIVVGKGPSIGQPNILAKSPDGTSSTSDNVKKGDLVSIKSTIKDLFQVAGASASLTTPNGDIIEVPLLEKQNDVYNFVLDTNDKIDVAGTYKGIIKAKSSKADLPEASTPFTMNILCGDKENGYGRCQDDCSKSPKLIFNTLFGCAEGKACCQIN